MRITFDPSKREKTRIERGIDFLDAELVFAGRTATLKDDRRDYGEERYQTYGLLRIGWSWWSGPHAKKLFTSSR